MRDDLPPGWSREDCGDETWAHGPWRVHLCRWGSGLQVSLECADEKVSAEVVNGDVAFTHEIELGGQYGTRGTTAVYIPFVVLAEFVRAVERAQAAKTEARDAPPGGA